MLSTVKLMTKVQTPPRQGVSATSISCGPLTSVVVSKGLGVPSGARSMKSKGATVAVSTNTPSSLNETRLA